MQPSVSFTQRNITLPDQIAGILTIPQSAIPTPGVILLHGFASQKDEVGGYYRMLSASLANRGILSLRIDFRGCGESGGNFQELTIHSQVQDAQNAIKWLTDSEYCQPSRLGLVGFSLGAAIAMIAAAQNPIVFKSLVLLSPVANMAHDLQSKYGQYAFIQAKKQGFIDLNLQQGQVRLKSAFFESLNEFDLSACIKSYSGALLALAGEQDYSATNATLLAASSSAHPKEALIITNTDHVFGILSEDKSVAITVIELATRWLVETL